MRILLTGVTGYLGSHLANALLANGHKVIGLKRKTSSLRRIEDLVPKLTLQDIEETDIPAPFTRHGKIDVVIHTSTCYGRDGESASQLLGANLAFPLKLLQAAATSGVNTFVNTDTVLDKLLNPYALSKAQFTEWGRYYAQHERIQFLNLKLEHFYGSGDDQSKFTTHVVKSCLSNVPELKLTQGQQQRDFIYIDDVVAAYLLLLDKRASIAGNFVQFEVGNGAAITIKDFVETVHRLTASTTRLNFGALPYREGESMISQANTSALQSLGWGCRHCIESGLKLTIDQERQLS